VLILRKHIPIAMAFTMGIIGIILFFSPTQTAQALRDDLSEWGQIILAFAMIVGIYSLLNHHYHKIKRKVPGWGYSTIVYIAMVIMVVCGWWFRMEVPEKEDFGTWAPYKQKMLLDMNGAIFVATEEERIASDEARIEAGDDPKAVVDTEEGWLDGIRIVRRVPIMWMYDFVFVPMQATMFSLLAFYIASAAYRAFRARTPEASVLLLTAIVMMLGRVPIGQSVWSKFPEFTDWILNTPSMAVMRAILMGVGLGMIATSLRIIFGIERTYMGGGGD
jgi:hypothetical protein